MRLTRVRTLFVMLAIAPLMPSALEAAEGISVTDCGAIPNDGNDDSTAFNTALAAAVAVEGRGVKVLVPAGTFNVKNVELRPDTTLAGAGIDVTYLVGPAGEHSIVKAARQTGGAILLDMTLAGDAMDSAEPLLRVAATNNITVERVKFTNAPAQAIVAGESWVAAVNILIKDIEIDRTGSHGIQLLRTHNVTIDHATITDAGDTREAEHGIYSAFPGIGGGGGNNLNLTIKNCVINRSAHHNIFLTDVSNVLVKDNDLRNSSAKWPTGSGSCIQMDRAYSPTMDNLVFTGNKVRWAGGYGISTTNTFDVHIVGNEFHEGTDPAIRLTTVTDWEIDDNKLYGTHSISIGISASLTEPGGGAGVISNNHIEDAAMAGIAASGIVPNLMISGNTILNCGKSFTGSSPESFAGIALESITGVTVTGNRIEGNPFGVYEKTGGSTADYNIVHTNDLADNDRDNLIMVGGHSQAYKNQGAPDYPPQ